VNLWPPPTSLHELAELEIREKPDWKGVAAHLVGWIAQIGDWLGIEIATRFLDEFATTIDGVIYIPRGRESISRSLELHEMVHHWQERIHRFYKIRYLISPWFRLHAEAQAYSLEVAIGTRTLQSAAEGLSDGIYFLCLDLDIARAWLTLYAEQWRTLTWLTWGVSEHE